MGLNLLIAIEQGSDGKYDDYIPDESQFRDTKPNMGLSRRQVGSDQAMRAGHILNVNTPAPGRAVLDVRDGTSATKPSFVDTITAEAELSDTDNEEHQQKRRRSANGRGRRRHLLSPTSARTRVLSSQARHSSKHIKTEESTFPPTKSSLQEMSVQPPRDPSNFDHPCSRFVVGKNSIDVKLEESKPLLKPNIRFRVDSRHLAALMAVGTSPPSSPS
jgi:hypothetical protein